MEAEARAAIGRSRIAENVWTSDWRSKQAAEVEADALVVLGFEGAPLRTPRSRLVKELYDSGEFTGKTLEIDDSASAFRD